MKQITTRLVATIAIFAFVLNCNAQGNSSPVDYLASISNQEKVLNQKYLNYMSAASHGRRMKKIERKRTELINSIDEIRAKINDLPSYNGDRTLRDSAVNYLKIMYKLFNEDYANLVNMEEIAEQSYDLMEAYLLAQQKAGEKLKQAAASYENTHKTFAKNNNITLIESTSEMGKKLDMVAKVQGYYNKIYLIFFKAYKQEVYLVDALKTNNANAVEQNRNSLAQYAAEGIEKLKELNGLNSDKSVENACRKVLEFYKTEAEKDFEVISEFLLTAENFEKAKKAFESSSKSRDDAEVYNKAVSNINKLTDKYNATNTQLNNKRNELLNSYESAVNIFMDTHMPYAK
jgi:hypothetical protein